MRPLKITMSAFGPYAGEVTLDMQKLGKSGIYLITGDTGAVKTTIFDAMSYALYGEASGNYKENTAIFAACPEENANPWIPPYKIAMVRSNSCLVGFSRRL